jgi:hypothetical protein
VQSFVKPEVKRLFERPGRRWEGNIKIDFKEMEWKGLEWIRVVHNRDKPQDRERETWLNDTLSC